MANGVNKIIKTLQPLINQRLKDLESGVVQPGSSAPVGVSSLLPYLNMPEISGPLPKARVPLPVPNSRQTDYNHLDPETQRLITSVRRMGFNPSEHHSLLGSVFNAVEKPFQGIAGAVEKQAQWTDQSHSGQSIWDKIKGNAEALGSGFVSGWEGKDKVSNFNDILSANHKTGLPSGVPDPTANFRGNKVLRAAVGLGGDVALDPLSYVGLTEVAKVAEAGKSASEISKIEDLRKILMKGKSPKAALVDSIVGGSEHAINSGKWIKKSLVPNAAQRALHMQKATEISKSAASIAFNQTFRANRIKAAREIEKETGHKIYKTLAAFRKGIGDPTLNKEELNHWNMWVNTKIETRAGELTGDRATFEAAKAADWLALATKNNFAGEAADVSKQIKRATELHFAGMPLARIRIPAKALDASKALANAEKVSGMKSFAGGVHEAFDKAFKTGSNISPLVNAMRMARHSSVIEKSNLFIKNTNSIWRGVTRAERKDVANAVAHNLTNVKVAAGHDFLTRTDVTDAVDHTLKQIQGIEDLVNKGHLTFDEFNHTLPTPYKINAKYGKSETWLQDALREQYLPSDAYGVRKLGEDPANFLIAMHRAAFTALADKELTAQIIKRFGHVLHPTRTDIVRGKRVIVKDGPHNPLVKVLKDKHGYRTPGTRAHAHAQLKDIPQYKGVVFEEEVARGIEAMHALMYNQAMANKLHPEQAMVLFSKATALFKTIVTKYNPGFHERNLLGEMMSSLADGVYKIAHYRAAAKVLYRHGATDLKTGIDVGKQAGRITNGIKHDAYEAARLGKHVQGTDVVLHRHFTDLASKGVTADQIWHAYVENGLKTGWITVDTGKYAGRLGGASVGSKANAATQHLTENIEDYARLAHFISRIERSSERNFVRAAEEAATYVRKFHFDYNDFTHFEKNVVSKIIPFYKWTRKNIPLQMALLFQRPGYFLAQMKGLSAISNATGFANNGNQIPSAESIMPQWLREHLAVPVGMGSSGTRYLDAPLPTTDAFKFFGTGPSETLNNALYMVNPMIKDPIELKTGHQIGGAPIQTDRYLAGLTPYTNLINNLRSGQNTGKTTNLLQFLLGAGFVENTPARIKSELKRKQSVAGKARKKYREQHNLRPLG